MYLVCYKRFVNFLIVSAYSLINCVDFTIIQYSFMGLIKFIAFVFLFFLGFNLLLVVKKFQDKLLRENDESNTELIIKTVWYAAWMIFLGYLVFMPDPYVGHRF